MAYACRLPGVQVDGDSFDDVPVGVEELSDAVAAVCHWPAAMSVFGVFGRMRVVPWSDGVAVPPLPVAALDSDFATSEVPNDFFGSADCLCLRGMYGTRPFSASSLDGPAVLVFDHVPVVVFRHGPILPASRAYPDIGSISMSLSSKIRPCRCREAQAPQEIADRLEPGTWVWVRARGRRSSIGVLGSALTASAYQRVRSTVVASTAIG